MAISKKQEADSKNQPLVNYLHCVGYAVMDPAMRISTRRPKMA